MASSAGSSEVPLGTYIFERIRSLGIEHVFGVPGDFNLNLLDHMSSSNIKWVGTCNELNAAYAADGYARVRGRGLPGVLITTYGVGELSAINGIAGAYAEHVPIIHIVGMTSRMQQRARMMIHHTLGQQWDSADHSTFMEMSKPVRTDSCFLDKDETFAQDVDRVIEACCKTRRPVYIYVPMDTPDVLIPSHRLKTPLDVEIRNGNSQDEDKIVGRILSLLKDAKSPAVLVDVLARRYGLEDEVTELLKITNLPVRLLYFLPGYYWHLLLLQRPQYWNLTVTAGIYYSSVKSSSR
jgi:pyruvate decarboxylase